MSVRRIRALFWGLFNTSLPTRVRSNVLHAILWKRSCWLHHHAGFFGMSLPTPTAQFAGIRPPYDMRTPQLLGRYSRTGRR